MTYYIDHLGFEFEVVGNFERYTPASMYSPPEGGFEMEDILMNGKSIYDLLNQHTIDCINELAFLEAQEIAYGY